MNKDLEKIKKWLPRGYGRIIQAETGMSLIYIYEVVAGKCHNNVIIDALLRLALRNKEESERQEKMLSQL